MTTAIATVLDRAIKALDVNEAGLRSLVLDSAEITTVTNSAGFAQAQAARMKLRTARIIIEKLGKSARDDANAFSKAVIEQEKKYIAIVAQEEERLQAAQYEFTAKIEAEKQAKIKAEIDRKDAIQAAINSLNDNLRFGDNSTSISEKIVNLESVKISKEALQERFDEALDRKKRSLLSLIQALEETMSTEKAKADQAAAAEILRKKAETDRAAREQAEREAEAARAESEAVAKAERDRIAEVAYQAAVAKRIEAERIAKAERANLEKQKAEERAKRIAAEKESAQLKADAKAALDKKAADDAAKAEAERKAAAAPDKDKMIAYAKALINVPRPEYDTVAAQEAGVNMVQAVINLHKRIIAKAEEL